MRPTSAELLERIAETLDQIVLPAVGDDKWAASAVRSSTTLLAHLAKRVELEAPILLADNHDARAVLAAIGPLPDAYRDLQTLVNDVLKGEAPPAYDSVALDARNRDYQSVIEKLLSGLYEAATPGSREAEVRSTLRDYLKRHMARERDIYFPAFMGPPF